MTRLMLTLVAVSLLVAGCSDYTPTRTPVPAAPKPEAPKTALTKENYLKIQPGMQEDEVVLILGESQKRKSIDYHVHKLIWIEGDKEIVVSFSDEKQHLRCIVVNKHQKGLN